MTQKSFEKPIVFINYRRSDSLPEAGRLSGDLDAIFGDNFSFQDIENIRSGAKWIEKLIEAGLDSKIVLVVIGEDWLEKRKGQIRLFEKGDWVRRELVSAIEAKKVIIPILIDNASLPDRDQLPEDLHPLLDHQAFPIRQARWKYDLVPLIDDIKNITGVLTLTEKEEIEEQKRQEQLKLQESRRRKKRKYTFISYAILSIFLILGTSTITGLIDLSRLFESTKKDLPTNPNKDIETTSDEESSSTVTIGNQIWMTQNMNTNISGSLYHPDIKTSKDSMEYGKLYTWEAAQKACPTGWHLPSHKEWSTLANTVSGYIDKDNPLEITDQNKSYSELRLQGKGFLGITLGGLASEDGSFIDILDEQGFYWTSSKTSPSNAQMFRFRKDHSTLTSYDFSMKSHLSCRCIKDVNQISDQAPKSSLVQFYDHLRNKNIDAVKIGDQIWMAKNLDFETPNSICYENDPKNCDRLGQFYTWEDAQNACPEGWRIPSDQDWQKLLTAFGGYRDGPSSKSIGYPRKTYKALINGGSSDFNVLLYGKVYKDGEYEYRNYNSSFWTSKEDGDRFAWMYYFYAQDKKTVSRLSTSSDSYLPCRCIKD